MRAMNIKGKVFVTGADGMLGASICRELLNQGYRVKGLVLPNRNAKVLDGLEMEIVNGNILEKSNLKKQLSDCDYLIHCAALTTIWPRRLEAVRKVNFIATQELAEISMELKLKRMIYIGSASSFGYGSKSNPGDETVTFQGGKFKLDYIDSKYQAQRILLKKFRENGLPVVIINPTFMIGPYDSGPSSGRMIIAFLSGKLPGYASGGRNFVYSVDVAKAAVNAIQNGRLGECYIAGNENLDYGTFFKKVSKIFGTKFNMIRIPSYVILMTGLLSSLLARITRIPPRISYTMARIANVGQYYSSKKAIKELRIPQTPIEVAIKDCCEWFKSQGYLQEEYVER